MALPLPSEKFLSIYVPALDQLAEGIEAFNPTDRQGFQEILTCAVEVIGIKQGGIAARAGKSPGTVSKWLHGYALPPPPTREVVSRFIAAEIRNMANRSRMDLV